MPGWGRENRGGEVAGGGGRGRGRFFLLLSLLNSRAEFANSRVSVTKQSRGSQRLRCRGCPFPGAACPRSTRGTAGSDQGPPSALRGLHLTLRGISVESLLSRKEGTRASSEESRRGLCSPTGLPTAVGGGGSAPSCSRWQPALAVPGEWVSQASSRVAPLDLCLGSSAPLGLCLSLFLFLGC